VRGGGEGEGGMEGGREGEREDGEGGDRCCRGSSRSWRGRWVRL